MVVLGLSVSLSWLWYGGGGCIDGDADTVVCV